MAGKSDKIKLGLVGASLGVVTLAALGLGLNVDNTSINNKIINNTSIVESYNSIEASQPQSDTQQDTDVFEKNGKYTGKIVDGEKNDSSGKFLFNNGCIYEGSFVNNKIEGKGKLTIPKTGIYEGDFSNGKKSGSGKMSFLNWDIYNGEWKDDKMAGTGTYTFANGDKYEGEFSENKFNGSGTYSFKATGKKYSGKWLNNSYKG